MIIEVRRGERVQRLTYDDFEARIREGDIRAETPVRFPLVTGEEFRPAGELELFAALADPDARAFRQNLNTVGIPLATALLVGLQLRIYLLSWAPEAEPYLQSQWTNWNPPVMELGEVWRLLSYGLLHVDLAHITFNLLFIAYAGYHLERAVGWRNLLTLFFGSVVGGGLLSLFFSPGLPTLGSSGGGFGLLSASVIFGWKHWEAIPERARKAFGFAILPYPVLSLISNLGAKNVDNWCHLGGALAGALLMTLLEPEAFSARRRRNRIVRGLTFGGIGALLAGLWAFGPRLVQLVPEEETGVVFSRPQSWRAGGAFTGEAGWFSPTGAASVVAVDDVGTTAISLEQLEGAWLNRLQSGASKVAVQGRVSLPLEHATGEIITVSLDFDGVPQQVDALLIARGVYSYRVQVMTQAELRGRLDPLVRAMLNGVTLTELPDVAAARAELERNPRSWGPRLGLAEALGRAGEWEAALENVKTALIDAPDEPELLAAQVRLVSAARPSDGPAAAAAALARVPDEPRIIVAAAEALRAAGQEAAAVKLLDDSWLKLPGDRVLKKARRAWGLPVTLPAPPAP